MLPAVVSIGAGLLSGLGGHKDVAGERDPNVAKIRAITDLAVLQTIADGGTTPAAANARWLNINAAVNWSDGKVGRAYERQVAQETLAARRAGTTPAPMNPPPPEVPSPTSPQGIARAVIDRAVAAGQTELAARVEVVAGVAAEQGARREQRAALFPMLTPGQLSGLVVAAGVAVLLLVLWFARRRG